MQMRLWKMLGCAALGVLLAAPARAENIKIGVMLPYSGVNADLGDVQDKAIDLFMKLHGKDLAPNTVELIKRDEGPPSGANAKTVATELITRDKVKLILGVVFSPSAIAMAQVMTQPKIPLVIANAGTAWITTLSPYIVRFSFSMWHDAYPMGTYAAKDLKCSMEERRHVGNLGGIAHRNRVQRVKDQKPDCFYVFIPSGAHASAVVKTYGEVGLKQAGVKLIGPKDVVPDSKLQAMGDAAIGTIVMSSYSGDLDNAVNKQFVKAWHDAYGADNYPDFMSAAAWDAMNAVFHTIKELNGKVDDGLKFVDALKSWSGEGPRGNVKIDPATRDIVQDERAMEVYRKPDGKLGTKVLGTIPQVKDECKELKLGRCGGQ